MGCNLVPRKPCGAESSVKSSVLVCFSAKRLSPSKSSGGRTVRPGTDTPWTALEKTWVALWVSSVLATVEHGCVGPLESPDFESGLGCAGSASFCLGESLSPWVPTSTPQTSTSAGPHLRGLQGGEKNKDIQQHKFKRLALFPIRLSVTFLTLKYPFFYQEAIVNVDVAIVFFFFFNFLT